MTERGTYLPLTWNRDTGELGVVMPETSTQTEEKSDTAIYIVETVSMFRIRYAVRARSAEHAADTVVMQEGNELSQHHLDEVHNHVREVSEAEYLKLFDADNDYLSSWDNAKKLGMIHNIDYDK